MEADSTTYESTKLPHDECFPFPVSAGNLKLYRDFIQNDGEKSLEHYLVERLQSFGLLPDSVPCSQNSECKVVRKPARVIDKVQWYCEGCGKRQPIRTGSFFLRVQCSLLQALQVMLAWSEDADCAVVADHFNVKPKVAALIYDRLDELAVKEQSKCRLGGQDSVVLAEMYPDCLNRLSPDTTDQPHVHRILMLADTNHIPTRYQLHVIRDNLKKNTLPSSDTQGLKSEIEEVVSRVLAPDSTLIVGHNVPSIEGASSIQQLSQYCDADMQHFLNTRIWRQAVSLCAASRDLCTGTATVLCAGAVQRYLDAALHRLRVGEGFYERALRMVAREYTETDNRNLNLNQTQV